jgi:hypothetical protein
MPCDFRYSRFVAILNPLSRDVLLSISTICNFVNSFQEFIKLCRNRQIWPLQKICLLNTIFN